MDERLLLAYLDHNVLDSMLKGDPSGMRKILKDTPLTPVYSYESLAEIHRSTGYENEFLQLLDSIQACRLELILDEKFQHTGKAQVQRVSPYDAYKEYVENMNAFPERDCGLSSMLQKFYGGRQDQSYDGILLEGKEDLLRMLNRASQELAKNKEFNDTQKEPFDQVVKSLEKILDFQWREVAMQFEKPGAKTVGDYEEATHLGPKVLMNVKGPKVVDKIWELVKGTFHSEAEIDMDTFFGIDSYQFEANADREKSVFERVNAIYHQLNFLGYYRDTKMSKPNRFAASFSDMTHAGFASFCQFMFSGDERLVMKAAAAYEYLSVGTKIIYTGV